jgi:hypothetical protein
MVDALQVAVVPLLSIFQPEHEQRRLKLPEGEPTCFFGDGSVDVLERRMKRVRNV